MPAAAGDGSGGGHARRPRAMSRLARWLFHRTHRHASVRKSTAQAPARAQGPAVAAGPPARLPGAHAAVASSRSAVKDAWDMFRGS